MSIPQFSSSNDATAPADANQALCADLSLLFKTLLTGLSDAIARTGGRLLADQFTQQMNRYAGQHGWQVLTGLSNLNELGARIPDVDARMLLSVYRSYARQAQLLARQILGEQLLKSTVAAVLSGLPARLAALNEQYGLIGL
jgi:hypothetical protein